MLDSVSEAGVKWLERLLEIQGINTQVSIQTHGDEDGESCWLVIDETPLSEEQIQILIGKHGAVLDSIQYLANTTLNIGKPPESQQAFTIELAGYRAKRQAELQEIAANAAQQVKDSGEEFEIRGLSSAERRQVHHFLKTYEGLETFSRGREPDRRLVVRQLS